MNPASKQDLIDARADRADFKAIMHTPEAGKHRRSRSQHQMANALVDALVANPDHSLGKAIVHAADRVK
jgi:hypothetical protein